jgi:hypothetical protein
MANLEAKDAGDTVQWYFRLRDAMPKYLEGKVVRFLHEAHM